MKYKTSELFGALLDSAVAKADGMDFEVVDQKVWGDGSGITFVSASPACRVNHNYFEPSTSWADGGPIIEREEIQSKRVIMDDLKGGWGCYFGLYECEQDGSTLLVAAMRAFVSRNIGDEVDL